MTIKQTADTAWGILGEGEDSGTFFSGSMAEATDDAISVTIAVLLHGVTTYDEYEEWLERQ